MSSKCDYCGEDLLRRDDLRVDARFCKASHKITFHNEQRKLKRAYHRATQAIDLLVESLNEPGELAYGASVHLQDIRFFISEHIDSGPWSCHKCGQERYTQPADGDVCPFCGKDEWKVTTDSHGLPNVR